MLARPISSVRTTRCPLSSTIPPTTTLLHLPAKRQPSSVSRPRRCTVHSVANTPKLAPPPPTPVCPDAPSFLQLIGRSLYQKHGSKIPTWDALFSLSSSQLRELGVEPARDRRYLLRWREKFRRGDFGFGGELKEVGSVPVPGQPEGEGEKKQMRVAEVRLVEVDNAPSAARPTRSARPHKVFVNVKPSEDPPAATPDGETTPENQSTKPSHPNAPIQRVQRSALDPSTIVRGAGLKVSGARNIVGPHVQQAKGARGTVARIVLGEGLWEHRRGRKLDGGERRQAEVRAKRRAEERKTTRG